MPPRHAAAAFDTAIEVFARAGHTVHAGKSGCRSLDTPREALPHPYQRIWQADGLLVGGIPVYEQEKEPVLARDKLREVVSNAAKEADFLVKLVRDDQAAAEESWSRVQATLLILRHSLAAKLIYFAQSINPEILEPFALQFDNVMRNAYLKIVDVELVNNTQRLQLSLPLRHGGCGLRLHTANELQRLFVSSALQVAPAVHAATGLPLRPADPAAQNDAEIFCPFEYQLRTSLESLEARGITLPDFENIGPADAPVWADSVAENFSIKSREDLDAMFEDLPARDRDYHKARVKSCSGVGAQW